MHHALELEHRLLCIWLLSVLVSVSDMEFQMPNSLLSSAIVNVIAHCKSLCCIIPSDYHHLAALLTQLYACLPITGGSGRLLSGHGVIIRRLHARLIGEQAFVLRELHACAGWRVCG